MRSDQFKEIGMNVGELCNREVVFASREMGVVEAARLMREHHVGSLVVVAERQAERVPVGMLTDRDIVVAAVAKQVDPSTLTVGDVMSAGALVVREQDGIADALRVMREKGVRRLPVVNARGVLVGIVAIDDVLELVAEEMDAFVHTLRSERLRETRVRR
jgi:CBS domain-containing protein